MTSGGLANSPSNRHADDQYEMAYRMQTPVPELADLSDEPESTFERYGPDSRRAGLFARNCLLSRLAERDVDQRQAVLVTDLKERGLLDDTWFRVGRRVTSRAWVVNAVVGFGVIEVAHTRTSTQRTICAFSTGQASFATLLR